MKLEMYKCDRCGVHFEDYEERHNDNLFHVATTREYRGISRLDLCPTCFNELQEFIKKGENEDGRN